MQFSINVKIAQFYKFKRFGTQKCPIYLVFLWTDKAGMRFTKQISASVRHCYFSLCSQSMSKPIRKNVFL